MKELVIIGAGGHARPVVEIAQLNNINLVGIVDTNFSGNDERILGAKVIGGMDVLNNYDFNRTALFLAIGDNIERKELTESLINKGFEIMTLVHPNAIVSSSAELDSGVLVCAGAIINPLASVGIGTIVNTGTIIDHETQIGAFCHLAPGVKIAGRVKIGDQSFIGIGSSVIDKIQIGEEAVIGAGSVVIKNIPGKTRVVGVSKFLD